MSFVILETFLICLRHKSCLILFFKLLWVMLYRFSAIKYSVDPNNEAVSCFVYGGLASPEIKWVETKCEQNKKDEREKFSNFSICNFIYDFFSLPFTFVILLLIMSFNFPDPQGRKISYKKKEHRQIKLLCKNRHGKKIFFFKITFHSPQNGWVVIFMELEILSGQRNKIYGKFKFPKHKKGPFNLRKQTRKVLLYVVFLSSLHTF